MAVEEMESLGADWRRSERTEFIQKSSVRRTRRTLIDKRTIPEERMTVQLEG